MKKLFSIILLLMLLSFCGCSGTISKMLDDSNIETLKSWSIQYNEGAKDYSVFFGPSVLNQPKISTLKPAISAHIFIGRRSSIAIL